MRLHRGRLALGRRTPRGYSASYDNISFPVYRRILIEGRER